MTYNSTSGERAIQYINMDKDNWNISFSSSYGRVLWKKIDLRLNSGIRGNYSNSYNYLAMNGGASELNNNQTFSIGPSFDINTNKANKWNAYVSLSPRIQKMTSTLQPDFNSSNFVFNTYGWLSYTFPKDFKISLDIEQSYEAATRTLASVDRSNVSGTISKKFLKDKSLEAQIFVNDIFNNNIGVYRSQYGYSFSQTTNDVLRRYGMFKLIYNFTTMKGSE